MDEPCRLDLAGGNQRQLTPTAERDVKLVESLVDWRSTPLQGAAYDYSTTSLLVTTDPAASRKEQDGIEDTVRAKVPSSAGAAMRFRPGCFSNSELAGAKDGLVAGAWLKDVNAAFTVSYDADDGHIRLAAEPFARQVASQAVVTYQPVVRLVQ